MELELGMTQEESIIEAKAYFTKRCPKVIEYLRNLAKNYSPDVSSQPSKSSLSLAMDQQSQTSINLTNIDIQKDPPTIVSSRIFNDKVYDIQSDGQMANQDQNLAQDFKSIQDIPSH